MAIPVAVAVGDVADQLVATLGECLQTLKVDPGTEPVAEMGPLVTRAHLDKVSGYVARGVEEGATLGVDGRGLTVPGCEEGFFLGGCPFDHVTTEESLLRHLHGWRFLSGLL